MEQKLAGKMQEQKKSARQWIELRKKNARSDQLWKEWEMMK